MTEDTAQQMRWAVEGNRYTDKMIHPSDGSAWKNFVKKFPLKAGDPRSVAVAISTDGFNPYGPKYPGKNMNVYLEPLVDDLVRGWEGRGIRTYDASKKEYFDMQAVTFFWLNKGGKYSCFDEARQFLERRHAYRSDVKSFKKGRVVRGPKPIPKTGTEIKAELDALQPSPDGNGFLGYGETHQWTHKPCLWKLPYFEFLELPHNIDVMHIEKNISEAIWSTIVDTEKTKDNIKARIDQERWYRSGGTPALRTPRVTKSIAGRRREGSQPAAALGSSRLYRAARPLPAVVLAKTFARLVGQSSTSTTSPSTSEMADGTPVTYEELPDELKKRYDEIKVTLEADLIGSFHRTRSHGIRWKGFSPQGALDGIDLSAPSEERTRGLRQEINYLVAHSLHRHSETLVNVLERLALRVIQEIMSHQSPSGPALGTHQGELPLQSRPPLPYALAAPPEVPATPAFVVYKIGGDPSDYQFLTEAPKEIPQGYACTYVPDCGNWVLSNQATTSGTPAKTGETSATELEKQTWLTKYATPTKLPSPAPAVGSELEKQAWLAKYATPANLQSATSAASTADQISTILRDQFGMVPKRRAIGYSKPYPDEYEMIPLPPKYRLPDFSKFSGSDGSSSIEHVGRYLAQLGPASVSDQLRVRLFSQSLTGSAFGWYTSLPANSIQSWKQLEEQFHTQYHSEASESSIADLAQLRQKRGETVTEYIQRFRNLRNRCYLVRITEKEAVELAVAGLATQLKDMASQADYPSMAHMVQKLSAYEQRHPDLYQDKFKRAVVMVDTEEDEVPAGDQEVAVAEWTRGGAPVSCKWVKPPGPPRGFDFDVTKTEQIFDLLLKEKQLTIPEGLKFPTAQELNGKPYCKFHNSLSHATNDCRVWRQHIQAAIEKGR
ncbi:hypothetical protein QYE76_035297 [Lolium multiflorum]|uniref:Retrotransposon gag domain-containing protein n=1 Tax=Lolium multiflorum TaxID=4521 RepID=A0AAD8R288_LOLMU|nr:hypothetical protein QYE76_035297 [Lolium multiflorum]